MKLFIRLLLAISLAFTSPMLCLAQGRASSQKYNGVPIGETTTELSDAYPYFKEVTVSKQFVEKQKAADPIRYELNEIKSKIRKFEYEKRHRRTLEQAAPQDNTRVARLYIPEKILNQSQNMDQALQKSRQTQEEKEIAALKKRRAELIKRLEDSGEPIKIALNENFHKLSAQAKINEAFALYKQSASFSKYEHLPEFKYSPKQVQDLITSELKEVNEQLQKGPAYKAFTELEEDLNRTKRNKLIDFVLMSVVTLVFLRGLKGASISAPSATFLSKAWYGFKKLINFTAVIAVYSGIDEVNLRAVNISLEEMFIRFTSLQDNMQFLQKIIKDGEKALYTEPVKIKDQLKKLGKAPLAASIFAYLIFNANSTQPLMKIPAAWSTDPDDAAHQTALRRLYGLRAINAYLRYSTVHYKFDLAMLDLFNLFSDEQNIAFDLSVFDQYEIKDGKVVQLPGKTNSVKINASASLAERVGANGKPSRLIQNLNNLPSFTYYKKTYYKDIANPDGISKKNQPILVPVQPQYIIRNKDGQLIDCGFWLGRTKANRSGEVVGYNMNSTFEGAYYMRIEPVAEVHNESYRNKPTTYVFEDINTFSKNCGDITIMA